MGRVRIWEREDTHTGRSIFYSWTVFGEKKKSLQSATRDQLTKLKKSILLGRRNSTGEQIFILTTR